ncbi:CDP-glycerol glycerophosphotransferase family protein [Streptomyces beihaiensis]|uniref:CDP-glycerol glycerophosphotransferase family protein n=1 Tax=Streptomyces beihaiensis TaxID=2984495 RepID=A0ABT3TSU9_9ACTN|nr:CDP-glycerol glycerophosphotransferase family protein [Streptomyces beihaiensis]MCX3060108.1 CDP-glycerol glycerophosphotransferase family protein [Streptomyces beihaiensis]
MSTRTGAAPAELFDVSVVVDCPAGTDPAALRATVASVTAQTLVGTEAVLVGDGAAQAGGADLAADQPHRVRVADAPRGTYVLPLTPGERLERDACRNLYAAARRTGADLVAGRWTRKAATGTKEHAPAWQAGLYRRSRVLTDVAEAPELVTRDALEAGYCVRRTLLDAVRGAGDAGAAPARTDTPHRGAAPPAPPPRAAYGPSRRGCPDGFASALAAARIALVPNLITTGRAATDPLRGLPEAVGAQRRALAALDDPELRGRRAHAFLVDHVLPCARAFLGTTRRERTERAAAYAQLLDGLVRDDALHDLAPLERIAVRLLADGDADGVLAAAYALEHPGTVVTPLVRDGGRVHWSPLRDGADYDVTELGHQHRALGSLHLLNRVTRCAREGGKLVVEGEVAVPFALLDGTDTGPRLVTAGLALTPRGTGSGERGDGGRATFPVDDLRLKPDAVAWRADLPLTRDLRPRGIGDRVWDARLLLGIDGERLPALRLFAEKETVPGREAALPARPRLTRLTADTWQPYVTAGHHLALALLPRRRPARLTDRATRYVLTFRPARAVKRTWRRLRKTYERLNSQRVKLRVYRKLLLRLPVSRGTVVFESHMGKGYSDSPRAVHEELMARRRGVRAVWSYATSPAGFPKDAKLVRRWSWRYLWALARAEWWVDNQGFPHALDKPKHTTYLQTWHGSAYKRMGNDEIRHKTQNAPQRAKLARAIDRFDHFLVRSEHDVNTLARAYRIPEDRLLRIGYPRNDRLVAARARDEREGRFPRPALAADLGIPDHRTVVLYAPTFRGSPTSGTGTSTRAGSQLPLDVQAFAEEFGDTHILLVRAHYTQTATLPLTPPGTVIDVSAHHDVSELLCLTDVLITDYSSIMFDYALLDRPLIHFTPDLDTYVRERGSYFDLRERAGGPVVDTQHELHRTLAGIKQADGDWQKARREFAATFGTYDDGGAARAVVDALFTRKAGGRP